jgi:hypothetical protein
MISYFCVSNRDINCLVTVILSNLNNNNFWVVLFYKPFIVKNLTVLFHSFFYFTGTFTFFLILLFQVHFLICHYGIRDPITSKPKINLHKKTIVSGIQWIEKTFLTQIKFLKIIKAFNIIIISTKKYSVRNQHGHYYVFSSIA